jgi:DNA-binding transcriptional ArsR family regulator
VTTDVFAALANPVRRQLLDRIRREPQPVKSLAAGSHLQRPAISEHLKVLRDAGLVVEETRGRENFYHLKAEPLQEVEAWLKPYEQFWRERFGALRTVLQQQDEDEKK